MGRRCPAGADGGTCKASCSWYREDFAPYPHPNPRFTPRPALAARALEGTRASGAQAVPSRPAGRWASPKAPATLNY
ncbi:hypothetical protein XANMN_01335 [Xanthomonas phaseoli pv. manihotis str. CIO151]|nr:hypothetical protein XANMN_01335 [Xanthomonas phaseoli pv. manihotis str. CIO151]